MILRRRSTIVAFAARGVCPAAAPLGCWSLDETAGPAVDLSGNGLDGTCENDANPDVTGAPGFASGAEFDGVDDQILIGGGFATGLGYLTNSFTVIGSPSNQVDNNFYIGLSCCAVEHFDGRLDEPAVFSGELTQQQIQHAMDLGVPSGNVPKPSTFAFASMGLLGLFAGAYRPRPQRLASMIGSFAIHGYKQ